MIVEKFWTIINEQIQYTIVSFSPYILYPKLTKANWEFIKTKYAAKLTNGFASKFLRISGPKMHEAFVSLIESKFRRTIFNINY
jgi:hypothetical protein